MQKLFSKSIVLGSLYLAEKKASVKADQPVHCLRQDIYGDWTFKVSKDAQVVDLFEQSNLCSHNLPNGVQVVTPKMDFNFSQADTIKVNLNDNYQAQATYCGDDKCSSGQSVAGKWTTIYDQALKVELQNGQRFVANFRYNAKPTLTTDPVEDQQRLLMADIHSGDYGSFDSDCRQTMVGFVQSVPSMGGSQGSLTAHNVQCFHGNQDKYLDIEGTETMGSSNQFKFAKITRHNTGGSAIEVTKVGEDDAQKPADKPKQQMAQSDNNGDDAEPHPDSKPPMPAQAAVQTDEQKTPAPEAAQPQETVARSSAPVEEAFVQLGATSGAQATARTKMKIHKRASGKRSNPHYNHVPSDEMDLLIEQINTGDFGWKADVCMLQKHHHMYDSDKCDKKKDGPVSLAQTSNNQQEGEETEFFGADQTLDGKKNGESKKFGEGDEFAKAWNKFQDLQQKYSSASSIPETELPEQFDLRNINGFDFTGGIRNQGPCGSCYTVSFTQAMESRLKVKYGKEVPELSPQMLLNCNYMTEGCEGGWPHFHAYFAEQGHLVEEKCAPYQSSTVGKKCSDFKDCAPVAKVAKSYDVGGAYGQSNEADMMKEVLRNGALCTEFQAPNVFATYSSGLFTANGFESLTQMSQSESEGQKAENISTKTLNQNGYAWKNLNHSVIVVGWGVDKNNGSKYWIVRNSYGPSWGMGGDFMIRRGGDEMGIESEQVAFEPELLI